MCRGAMGASGLRRGAPDALGLVRGYHVNTFDLCFTAVAWSNAKTALPALRMIRARSAAGTLASACAAVARLPLELWAAIEDALIDIGWSAARREHFEVPTGCCECECVPPCEFMQYGIDGRTFESAKPACRPMLEECWYECEIGYVQVYAEVHRPYIDLAELFRQYGRSSSIIISLSSTLSALDGGTSPRGSGRRRL